MVEATFEAHDTTIPAVDLVRDQDDDNPDWFQLYEVELNNCRPVYPWFAGLLKPADPATAFDNAAKFVYGLAGLTEGESAACLAYHKGDSFRKIAKRLDRDVKTIFGAIRSGETKLRALKDL